MGRYGLCDLGQGVELVRSQHVGEAMAHGCQVEGGGSLYCSQSTIGEHNVKAPRIALARSSFNGPPRFHPGDLVGQPAPLPSQCVAEISRPQPPARRFGDGDQYRIVSFSQTAFCAQLPRQVSTQFGPHPVVAAPSPVFPVVQPAHLHAPNGTSC